MFKKCVIFLFLATAYSVLLAHNFTPHHHDTAQTTHHHGHGHNNDGHDDDNKKNSFDFFQHIGESGLEYTPGRCINYDLQKKACETAFINLAGIFFSPFEKPPLIGVLLRKDHLSIQQTRPYFFLLKAPPAFTA